MRYESLTQYLDVRINSGEEAYALCPFHQDHNPSFAFNKRTGLWICHGCKSRGNAQALVKKLDGTLPPPEVEDVLDILKDVESPKQERVFPESWLVQFPGHDYWLTRGVRLRSIERFQLGMDIPSNRATIPIRRHTGALLGVAKRAVGSQKPKYMYPSGFNKARELFASWLWSEVKHPRHAVLVEGALDAIACWEAKRPALAVYGSHLSDAQRLLLKRLGVSEVTVLMDADTAGKRAERQTIETLGNDFLVYRARLRSGDPLETPRRLLRETVDQSRPV